MELVGDLLLDPADCPSEAPGFEGPLGYGYVLSKWTKQASSIAGKSGGILDVKIMNKTKNTYCLDEAVQKEGERVSILPRARTIITCPGSCTYHTW